MLYLSFAPTYTESSGQSANIGDESLLPKDNSFVLLAIITSANLLQLLNTLFAMAVTVAGIVISGNEEQFSKVLSFIVVTFSPNVTLLSAVHPLKLYAPMDSTELGIIIFGKLLQPSKALLLIVVTFSPSVTLLITVQSLKLYAPIDSTELGIIIFGKLLQPSKAFDSILMTFVISTDFMLLQS